MSHPHPPRFSVAVVQAATVTGDLPATLDKIERLVAECASRGARLALFPEAFIGGYPRGMDFGATVGSRSAAGRDQYRSYWHDAIEVPGEATARLGEIAALHEIHLVMGVIERDGGTLYCTVLFHGPDGRYLGKHRKLMPTGSERLIWGFGDGSTMPVLDTPIGRMGAVICWENYMPLMRAAHYAKGIQIYLAPTADGRDTWLPTMRHIALEGRCFVLSANQFCRRGDAAGRPSPANAGDAAPPGPPGEILANGGSCIVGPLGEVLAGPDFERECVLVAEIDLGETVRGKFDFDVVGHYARPDIFQLQVNESAAAPVVFRKD